MKNSSLINTKDNKTIKMNKKEIFQQAKQVVIA
jgi:hypothetical protein